MDKKQFIGMFCNNWNCDKECKLPHPAQDCIHEFLFGKAYGWIGTCNPCYMVGHFVAKDEENAQC